jgi:alpha-ketoglutarate-dependent taurine dioxygenase
VGIPVNYKETKMRTIDRVRGTIVAAGLKHREFCEATGITRQTLDRYRSHDIVMEHYDAGQKAIHTARAIHQLCEEGKLPMEDVPDSERVKVLKELIKSI